MFNSLIIAAFSRLLRILLKSPTILTTIETVLADFKKVV